MRYRVGSHAVSVTGNRHMPRTVTSWTAYTHLYRSPWEKSVVQYHYSSLSHMQYSSFSRIQYIFSMLNNNNK